jgi:cysteine desulfurase
VGFLGLSSNSHGFCSQLGGGQESGRRGGTENVPSILAMGAALEFADEHLSDMDRQSIYRDEFETVLESILPELECIGKSATRVPNTSFLIMPRFENIRWVRKLDIKGFQVSTGSACSTGDTASSPILNAMGYPEDLGRRTIRISAGPSTSRSDWERLAEAFREVWSDLQKSDCSSESEVISI